MIFTAHPLRYAHTNNPYPSVKSKSVLLRHFIYPYFSPDPTLSDEAARVGLWAIGKGLPNLSIDDVRILDVIRGQTYSVDRNELRGNEEEILFRRYQAALVEREQLRREYD